MKEDKIKRAKTLNIFILLFQQNKEMSRMVSEQKAIFQVASRLIQAAKSTELDDEMLRGYLKNLKMQYMEEMKSQLEEWLTSKGEWLVQKVAWVGYLREA